MKTASIDRVLLLKSLALLWQPSPEELERSEDRMQLGVELQALQM
jgi:hypothetical protein